MDVRDVMTTDLVTVGRGDTLQTAVDRMLDHRAGSVLVVDDESPVGILTETDVLAVGTTDEAPFSEIPVSRATSENPVTVDSGASVDRAMELMHTHRVKKLPVVDDGDLEGIVTVTDLVYHRTDLAEEARAIKQQRVDVPRGE